MRQITAVENDVTEWSYTSERKYEDPFNEVELDIVITDQDGDSWRMPAYWAGRQEWRVRFLPPKAGLYTAIAVYSCDIDIGFHDVAIAVSVSESETNNPLIAHGALRVADSKETFKHIDETPFFWFGDTWWMGLCERLSWPDDFQRLVADRRRKGFSVIQIVAGLFPDMPGFDERGCNEAGFPWEEDYARINPAYFDMADLRIQCLIRSGLVPCILGAWGYYILFMGTAKMKQHWRYIIARWGAYPVVWCLAGEAAMPYYLSLDKESDKKRQIAGWTEVGRYVREKDPYSHLITIHPTQIGRDQVEDDSILDFDMLQTGHGGYESVGNTVSEVCSERDRRPSMPVVVGEVNYEGIMHGTQAEIQRLTFWSAFLSGAAGFTYGANGIWQVNTKGNPFGASPHGGNWGNTPWEDASQATGAFQLGIAKRMLEKYPWWEFEPRQDWVEPSGNPENVNAPFAAGIPKKIRIIYLYAPVLPWSAEPTSVVAIEPDIKYIAFFWDPRVGDYHQIGPVEANSNACWRIPIQPTMEDWVLVLMVKECEFDSLLP